MADALHVPPAIRSAVRKVWSLGEIKGFGGPGHIVFDDHNLDDESIDLCIDLCMVEATDNPLHHYTGGSHLMILYESEEERAATLSALVGFRRLPEAQRAWALELCRTAEKRAFGWKPRSSDFEGFFCEAERYVFLKDEHV